MEPAVSGVAPLAPFDKEFATLAAELLHLFEELLSTFTLVHH
jgi:hypothetical protein